MCRPFIYVMKFVCSKHTKKQPDAQDAPTNNTLNLPWPPQILLLFINLPSPHIKHQEEQGNHIVVETVVKANIGELEEES